MPGHELVDTRLRPPVHQAGQCLGEIVLWLDAIQLEVSMRDAIAAQLAPPSSLPANNAFFLDRATGRDRRRSGLGLVVEAPAHMAPAIDQRHAGFAVPDGGQASCRSRSHHIAGRPDRRSAAGHCAPACGPGRRCRPRLVDQGRPTACHHARSPESILSWCGRGWDPAPALY